jgi:hypothetical protein
MGWFNKEPACQHKWTLVDSNIRRYYWKNDTLPNEIYTDLLYECKHCGKHKVETIDGEFENYSRKTIIRKYLRKYVEEHLGYIQDLIKHYNLDKKQNE